MKWHGMHFFISYIPPIIILCCDPIIFMQWVLFNRKNFSCNQVNSKIKKYNKKFLVQNKKVKLQPFCFNFFLILHLVSYTMCIHQKKIKAFKHITNHLTLTSRRILSLQLSFFLHEKWLAKMPKILQWKENSEFQ